MKASGMIRANYYRTRTVIVAVLSAITVACVIFLSGSASAARPQSAGVQGQQGDSRLANFTFCRPEQITIPSAGPSTPYPSNIQVSRLGSSTSNVSVTLNRLRHEFYDDIDMLLVGPQGHKVLLMSDAGGSCTNRESTLTFKDGSSAIPDFGCPFFSDGYRPSNYESGPDNFPAPAPAPPYADTLSEFNGTNPNGTWSLFIVDDYGALSGRIAGGWCLAITTAGSR